MQSSRQARAAEIQDAIRQVLFRSWDPIGVNSNPRLMDEYDSYVPRIYRVLVGSRSEDALIEVLYHIERDQIGTACESPERLRPVARELLALDVRL